MRPLGSLRLPDGFAAAALLAALLLPPLTSGPVPLGLGSPLMLAACVLGLLALAWVAAGRGRGVPGLVLPAGALLIAALCLLLLLEPGRAGPGSWLALAGLGWLAWRVLEGLALLEPAGPLARRFLGGVVPLLFGASVLYLWQVICVGLDVPRVLLPAPGEIVAVLLGSLDTLWADFRQTFLKAVLAGFALGSASGLLVALLVDRLPFLRRGLLPLGSLVSAVPIVGIAPIMVMWFGFDWPSKAAVIVVMAFFPMLINATAGLQAAEASVKDLMRSYGASYAETLLKLRLPAALPFIFNALKINSTLALIGAIVAEFFGTPIVGMGFRISTEVGRMNIEMVWATIVVAAVAGSLFYGLLAVIERMLTFWHPSYRSGQ